MESNVVDTVIVNGDKATRLPAENPEAGRNENAEIHCAPIDSSDANLALASDNNNNTLAQHDGGATAECEPLINLGASSLAERQIDGEKLPNEPVATTTESNDGPTHSADLCENEEAKIAAEKDAHDQGSSAANANSLANAQEQAAEVNSLNEMKGESQISSLQAETEGMATQADAVDAGWSDELGPKVDDQAASPSELEVTKVEIEAAIGGVDNQARSTKVDTMSAEESFAAQAEPASENPCELVVSASEERQIDSEKLPAEPVETETETNQGAAHSADLDQNAHAEAAAAAAAAAENDVSDRESPAMKVNSFANGREPAVDVNSIANSQNVVLDKVGGKSEALPLPADHELLATPSDALDTGGSGEVGVVSAPTVDDQAASLAESNATLVEMESTISGIANQAGSAEVDAMSAEETFPAPADAADPGSAAAAAGEETKVATVEPVKSNVIRSEDNDAPTTLSPTENGEESAHNQEASTSLVPVEVDSAVVQKEACDTVQANAALFSAAEALAPSDADDSVHAPTIDTPVI